MQRLEISGAVRPIYGSLGVKRLITEIYMLFRNYYELTVFGPKYKIACSAMT